MRFVTELYRPHWGSKTLFDRFRKCRRLAYLTYHQGAPPKPPSPTLHTLWAIGRTVGALARQTFEGGVTVFGGETARIDAAKMRTLDLLRRRQSPIFEGVIQWEGVVVIPDILDYRPAYDAWELIEVKSTPGFRAYHLFDVGLQDLVLRRSGVRVHRAVVWTINPHYVRGRTLNLRRLFQRYDVTERVRTPAFEARLESQIETVRATLSAASPPPAELTSECFADGKCPFFEQCWEALREHPALRLPYLNLPQRQAMLREGLTDPDQLEGKLALHSHQLHQRAAYESGRLHADAARIRRILASVQWPVAALDFEYYNLVIPIFEGTRPGESLPFLYAAALEETPNGRRHRIHRLVTEPTPPGKEWIAPLVRFLESARTVVVFDQSTERRILEQWAEAYPDLAEPIRAILDRLVDLQPLLAPHILYHPLLNNSRSLKTATAVFSGNDPYRRLRIRDGFQAAFEFYRMMESADASERAALQRALVEYCHADVDSTLFLLHFALENAPQHAP